MAVDIGAVPMSDAFVAPTSPEMKTAVSKLKKRVPLGSTDMSEALSAAAASFAKESQAPRGGLHWRRSQQRRLGERRLAASAGVFGRQPRCNDQLRSRSAVEHTAAGGRCNQTGGMMIVDREDSIAKEAGLYLSRVAQEPVVWVRVEQVAERY